MYACTTMRAAFSVATARGTSLRYVQQQSGGLCVRRGTRNGYGLSRHTMCTTPNTVERQQRNSGATKQKSRLTLLFDGECPLCMKEVSMLRKRSEERGGTLRFVDIASESEFGDGSTFGIDYEKAMGRIHAVRPNGKVISGVQVFRECYEAVGLGWVYTITKWKPVLWMAEKVYNVWADRRLQLTGRDSLELIVKAREKKRTCR